MNDTFNAGLGGGNGDLNTLNPLDSLNGAGGTDTLNVQLLDGTSVQPRSLANIENVNLTVIDTTAATSATLDLLNAGQVENVTNYSSTASEVTFANIVGGANIAVNNVDSVDTNFSYVAGNTIAADLTVTNVGTANATTITISNAGASVNMTSAGTLANSVVLDTASNITTVTVAGTNDLTLSAVDATSVNANQTSNVFSGDLTFTAGVAATVNGGSGNDILTNKQNTAATISGNDGNDTLVSDYASGTQSVNYSGGAGNDTFDFTDGGLVFNTGTAANNDTVDGGTGTADVLIGDSADLDVGAAASVQSISGIEQITVSDALAGSLVLSYIQAGINTVNLADGVSTSAVGITFDSAVANATLNIANDIDASAILTLTAAGTATTDALTINNTSTVANDVFDTGLITAVGYEALTLNVGTSVSGAQALDNLTINDSGAEAVSITVTGANALTILDFDTNNTGLQTINASGLTLAAGTVFNYADGTFGNGATQSITGSEGNDSIIANNGNAATITGGAGNDTLTGGAAADSIQGGLGNDVISGGGGNDVLKGNEGADAITVGSGTASVFVDGGADNDTISVADTLDNLDTIIGGSGTDTLVVTATVESPSSGNRVFEVEGLTVNITNTDFSQDMSMFGNTTIATVQTNNTQDSTFTKAATTLTNVIVNDSGADLVALERLLGTSNDAVTISSALATTITALTLDDEETITLDTSNGDMTVTALNATLATSLTLTGDNDAVVSDIVGADDSLATITSTLTGAITSNVNADSSTINLTYTAGANTGGDSIYAGAGNDVITGATGVSTVGLTAYGANGADSITGTSAGDTLSGTNSSANLAADGADTLIGGAGADTLIGGTGADSIVGGDGTDTFAATGMNVALVDGTVATSTGAVINLSASTLSNVDITAAMGGTYGISTFLTGVASNQATYVYANNTTAGSNALDTLVSIENATGSGGTDYIVGSASANVLNGAGGVDTISGGAGNDTIIGGTGADKLTGGSDADVFTYTAVAQGGAVASAGATAIAAGDTITDFASATDDINLAATATGTTVVVSAAATIDLDVAGVVLVNTSLDFVAGTTNWTTVAAALNAAGDSKFDASAGTVSYFAVLDDNGAAADQYNIFEVTVGSTALTQDALVVTAETVSLIGTVTATLVAGDFILA